MSHNRPLRRVVGSAVLALLAASAVGCKDRTPAVTAEPAGAVPDASSGATVQTPRPTAPVTPVERTSEQACRAKRGLWGVFGFEPGCALPASDAGRPCRGRADCEGACVTDLSKPGGTVTVGGCYAYQHVPDTQVNFVEDGKARGAVIIN